MNATVSSGKPFRLAAEWVVSALLERLEIGVRDLTRHEFGRRMRRDWVVPAVEDGDRHIDLLQRRFQVARRPRVLRAAPTGASHGAEALAPDLATGGIVIGIGQWLPAEVRRRRPTDEHRLRDSLRAVPVQVCQDRAHAEGPAHDRDLAQIARGDERGLIVGELLDAVFRIVGRL